MTLDIFHGCESDSAWLATVVLRAMLRIYVRRLRSAASLTPAWGLSQMINGHFRCVGAATLRSMISVLRSHGGRSLALTRLISPRNYTWSTAATAAR